MITENNLYSTLIHKIPVLEQEFEKMGEVHCAYKIAALFAGFTKKQLRAKKHFLTRACFDAAEYILKNGDLTVKHAMENVYIFSVSQAFDLEDTYAERLPSLFKKEHDRKVNSPCIW